MKLTGNITSTTPATGTASVVKGMYDNDQGVIQFVVKITPDVGKPLTVQAAMSGDDVTALGATWGDTDLLTWFATKNGLAVS